MLQLWVLPEQPGQPADYKVYQPAIDELTRIYGDAEHGESDFPAKTKIDVALLSDGQSVNVDEPFLAYLSRGKGIANGEPVEDGDLIRGDALKFEATDDVQLVVVHSRRKL